MAIHVDACPSCGASLRIPLGQARFTCPYCSAAISIDLSGGEVNLAVADAINATATATQAVIQEGTAITQTEMRRMQLTQQLSQMELQLSNVKAEIRSIERSEMSRVSQNQLRDLRREEAALVGSIQNIRNTLFPPVYSDQPITKKPSVRAAKIDNLGIGWLLFSFKGAATVREYWVAVGVGILAFSVLAVITAVLGIAEDSPIFGLVGLISIWIYLAVCSKRYRDLNKSVAWLAIVLIPVIGIFWQFFELGFRGSQE